ncbi:MAG: ROK family protein, partial [Chloroflexota bacterium]
VEDRVSSLENEAAGPDMADQARARIRAGEQSILVDMVNGDVDAIDGAAVGRAAQQGDALARSIVQRSGKLVGLGIVNLLHLFNPEIIVIGGGVTQVGDLLFDPMHEAIKAHCIDDDYWKDLVITTPDLGEDVSIIGAATLVVTEGGKIQLDKALN